MNILAVIPSRYGSSRFPGKPLINLGGKTMVQRVYEGVKHSTLINEIVVATDDERILNEVVRFGGNVCMTSTEHPSGTDRCAEVAAKYEHIDVIVNIQGDEPLVRFEQIEQLLSVFNDPAVEIATLATRQITQEELTNSNRIKVVLNKFNEALYFSRSCIPFPQGKPSDKTIFLRHIGLYAYRRETLMRIAKLAPSQIEMAESLEQLRWLYNGYKIKVVETDIETPNIDVPEDVELVLSLLK
jgi:3-deoxy-manno-octulosonate cytidylyltransferase (CMP-KDO synthetase)